MGQIKDRKGEPGLGNWMMDQFEFGFEFIFICTGHN